MRIFRIFIVNIRKSKRTQYSIYLLSYLCRNGFEHIIFFILSKVTVTKFVKKIYQSVSITYYVFFLIMRTILIFFFFSFFNLEIIVHRFKDFFQNITL